MEYEITGGELPVAICRLKPGESMFTESGGMGWMSDNVEMSTNLEGGIFGGLKRSLAGESLFMTTYTCKGGEGMIAFPASFPGSIMVFDLAAGETIIAQSDAFLCAERSVQLAIHFRQKLGVSLFGGEGFVLQKLTGPGRVFLEIDGSAVKHTLQPGEALKIDPGHVAAMSAGVNLNIKMVKGFKNILMGGEGLFLAEARGQGDLWLQTMPAMNVARRIIPFLPQPKRD